MIYTGLELYYYYILLNDLCRQIKCNALQPLFLPSFISESNPSISISSRSFSSPSHPFLLFSRHSDPITTHPYRYIAILSPPILKSYPSTYSTLLAKGPSIHATPNISFCSSFWFIPYDHLPCSGHLLFVFYNLPSSYFHDHSISCYFSFLSTP